MASISVTLDSKASTPPEAPDFDNEEDFFDYLKADTNTSTSTSTNKDNDFFGTCNQTFFEDNNDNVLFPEFRNTIPIISAHTKIWRAGHTNDILSLITGTKEEGLSYLTGLLVSTITVLVCFLTWMIVLITLKGFGRQRVGFLSGRRLELPPRPESGLLISKGKDHADMALNDDGDANANGDGDASLPGIIVGSGETSSALMMPLESSLLDTRSSSIYLDPKHTSGFSSTGLGAGANINADVDTKNASIVESTQSLDHRSSLLYLPASTSTSGNDNDNGNIDSNPQSSSDQLLVFGNSVDGNGNGDDNGDDYSNKNKTEEKLQECSKTTTSPATTTSVTNDSSWKSWSSKSKGKRPSSRMSWKEERQSIKDEIEKRRGLCSTYTFPINFRNDDDHVDHRQEPAGLNSSYKCESAMFDQIYHEKYDQQNNSKLRNDLLRDHPDTVRKQYDFLVLAKQEITPEQFWKRYEYRCGDTAVKRLTRRREREREREQEQQQQKAPLSNDEWNELYATKKKEECWMKTVVLFACIIVICMAAVMARKGIRSLRGSLYEGKTTINYAQTLLTGAESVVDDLANGLEDFQTDVLDLLERANEGICPRLKPQGICPRLLEVDSCDFTIQIDLEKNVTIDKLDLDTTIDVSYNYSVDVSDVADNIKDKLGLNGTVDLQELLFPNAPHVYQELIEVFSRNWTIIDKMHEFADIINSMATVASQAEEQVSTIKWVFYVAVAFDVLVGLLAVCMIVTILVGEKLPQSLKCFQRRCLFPLFIVCVSLAFIFAILFFITSMALSDTCFNDPSENIISIAEYYVGDGLAAEYVLDFIQLWLSQCDKEPPSMQEDQAFFAEAQSILGEFNGAIQNVTESVTEFCGTTDPNLFADIISTSLKYLCGVIGFTFDLRLAFQCKTWMPLYYNTMYNAVCYNGISGVWNIAVTQFVTVFMACIILTFRAVFFDLEIIESDNNKVVDVISSSEDHNQNNDENEKKKNIDEGDEVTADQ